MKFKAGHYDERDLKYTDSFGDKLKVTTYEPGSSMYISVNGSNGVTLGPKKARKLAEAILKELDR